MTMCNRKAGLFCRPFNNTRCQEAGCSLGVWRSSAGNSGSLSTGKYENQATVIGRELMRSGAGPAALEAKLDFFQESRGQSCTEIGAAVQSPIVRAGLGKPEVPSVETVCPASLASTVGLFRLP
jgi:hypothetical protein